MIYVLWNSRKILQRLRSSAFILMMGLSLAPGIVLSAMNSAVAHEYSLTLYGGRMTEDAWEKSFSPNVDFVDAYLVVGAMAKTVAHLYDNALAIEIEGQVAKYFGDQEHLEFNLPVVGRWQKLPWNDIVETSFAFGIGPSLATKEPKVENEINETTQKFLIHWFAEMTLGPPDLNWAMALRLHHRSPGFGLLADDGGSNTLCVGLKIWF